MKPTMTSYTASVRLHNMQTLTLLSSNNERTNQLIFIQSQSHYSQKNMLLQQTDIFLCGTICIFSHYSLLYQELLQEEDCVSVLFQAST